MWITDINILNEIKGEVNRAYLAKRNLDSGSKSARNIDGANNNLTIAASYMTLLNEIGDNYQEFKDKIAGFNDIYDSAVDQVKA